jgi:hypothetical protein
MVSHVLFLAADPALDKIRQVPPSFWLKVGGAVLALVLFVVILRKVLAVNKFVMGGVLFVTFGLVGFNMLYHRTEPKFLTPFFDRIAPFFPSAGAYQTKQSTTPDAAKH